MGTLPPLREGNVWAIQLYPGGRKVQMQVKPERVSSFFDALAKLMAGQMCYVWPDAAGRVWKGFEQEQRKRAGNE